jgi:hypothetical protein
MAVEGGGLAWWLGLALLQRTEEIISSFQAYEMFWLVQIVWSAAAQQFAVQCPASAPLRDSKESPSTREVVVVPRVVVLAPARRVLLACLVSGAVAAPEEVLAAPPCDEEADTAKTLLWSR